MTRYLFDTNTLSALVHQRRGFGRTAVRVDTVAVVQQLVSAITPAELETMIAKAEDPNSRFAKVRLIPAHFNLVDIGEGAALHVGRIRACLEPRGIGIGGLDTLIAARARSPKRGGAREALSSPLSTAVSGILAETLWGARWPVCIRLPEELENKLDAEARREGVARAEVARLAIAEFLASRERARFVAALVAATRAAYAHRRIRREALTAADDFAAAESEALEAAEGRRIPARAKYGARASQRVIV